MMQTARLRTDIRLIPLVNTWYATPLLISPLTFALTTKYSHLPLLSSFLEAPDAHRTCARTPSLRGGPFVDYDGDPADIRQLACQTQERCATSLKISESVTRLYQLLLASGKGFSLSDLYEQVDEALRGSVELVYDVCKQPSVRFIEPAFYRSAACDPTLQSCLLESATTQARPFFLTTPLLARSRGAVELRAPFADPLWDSLFRRDSGSSPEQIVDQARPHLEYPERDLANLRAMLTQAPPVEKRSDELAAGSVRVRYFGHACVLLESATVRILIDPLVSYPEESGWDRFTFDDLPEHIDFVLITHAHVDHFVLETLLQLRHKIGRIVVGRSSGGSLQDISTRLALRHCGFRDVVELGEYEEMDFDGGSIVGAPFYGEHADLDVRAKLCYGVIMNRSTLVFLADSNPPYAACYENLKAILPRIDCLFVGMECVGAPASWTYGPLLQKALTRNEDQSRRLNGSNARTALELQQYFDPRWMFIYAMGAEPWVSHLSNIVPSEDMPQFQQARQLEAWVRDKGRHAELLSGKMQLML